MLGTAITLLRPFSSCAVRGGDARTVPERAVERSRRIGDKIEQCVDAVRVAVADGGDDVAVTVELLADAELEQVVGVLGERRSR